MNTLRFFYKTSARKLSHFRVVVVHIVSRASDSLYYRIIIYKGGIAYMRRTCAVPLGKSTRDDTPSIL